jgi:hypothetical protein
MSGYAYMRAAKSALCNSKKKEYDLHFRPNDILVFPILLEQSFEVEQSYVF